MSNMPIRSPKVGDTVEAYDGRHYLGEGDIIEKSTDILSEGRGTKLFPRYLVQFHDGTSGWFGSDSLTRV